MAPEGKCPNCGKPVWDQAGADQRLNKCWGCGQRFDTKPEVAAGPLASRYDSGFGTVDYTCDSCGSMAESVATGMGAETTPTGWTESGKSHRCPACTAGAAAPRGMSGEQLAALKAHYLEWSGGFEPETTEDIDTYADAAMDVNLDRGEAVNALTEWLKETDPSGIARRASR